MDMHRVLHGVVCSTVVAHPDSYAIAPAERPGNVHVLLAGILVSLLTQPSTDRKPQQEARLEQFYSLLRTPVQEGEEPLGPCQLPEGATPGPRKVFLAQTRLEIPIPGRRAILGFSAGWACVIALLAGIYLFIAK